MAKKRVHLTISGHVQGVYFRANARDRAKRLGVKGWVKNLPNGDVEAVMEGEEKSLRDMISWCQKGPPMARVDGVDVAWRKFENQFDDFRIKY
ncbi:MAG: acylphosphatase [Candidatus Acetothermia bacterium]